MTPSRTTADDIARLYASLSRRDQEILLTLHHVRLASARQLLRLHFSSGTPLSNARVSARVLQRLTAGGAVVRLNRRIGGLRSGSTGYIYQLARAGRIIVLGREKHHHPPHAYGQTFLGHALAVTELYVQVIEATRTSPITLVTFEIESQAWRTLPGIGRRLLKPDAFTRLATPQYTLSWFIEVDQGTESAPRISDKLITYSRYWANGIEQQTHNVFPKVLFVVLDADRKRQIKEVIAKQPKRARQLFQVELQADALQTLIGGNTL